MASVYFVYLLECLDGSIYTGISDDPERRLQAHRDGKGGSYTRSHGARRLLYRERHKDKGAALKREMEIKKWPRGKKLALAKKAARAL